MISRTRPQEAANLNQGWAYTNLAANATTVVKAAQGVLVGIVFNTAGASANVITLYDNASAGSGTKIGTVDGTMAKGTVLDYGGLAFANGLTAVIATGTAADITIIYG